MPDELFGEFRRAGLTRRNVSGRRWLHCNDSGGQGGDRDNELSVSFL